MNKSYHKFHCMKAKLCPNDANCSIWPRVGQTDDIHADNGGQHRFTCMCPNSLKSLFVGYFCLLCIFFHKTVVFFYLYFLKSIFLDLHFNFTCISMFFCIASFCVLVQCTHISMFVNANNINIFTSSDINTSIKNVHRSVARGVWPPLNYIACCRDTALWRSYFLDLQYLRLL